MMNEHTAKAFDANLRQLNAMVSEMGGLAEKQIGDSVAALVRRDPDLAREVIAADARNDALQRQIEELAVLVIARRQPMAVDLRDIVASMRIANDLERVGDLAKNTAKRAGAVTSEFNPPALIRGVEHMASMVQAQLKAVLDAYTERNSEKALAVWRGDREVDALCTSLFRELLTYMMENPRNITTCIHIMFCAKNIERIGDHATNIAETVYYMNEGHSIAEERPKVDTTTLAASLPGKD